MIPTKAPRPMPTFAPIARVKPEVEDEGCDEEEVNGGCEETKVNGDCEGTEVNGGCEETKVNGDCEGTEVNGGCEGTEANERLVARDVSVSSRVLDWVGLVEEKEKRVEKDFRKVFVVAAESMVVTGFSLPDSRNLASSDLQQPSGYSLISSQQNVSSWQDIIQGNQLVFCTKNL